MISVQDYDDTLKHLTEEYFIANRALVADIQAWAEQKGIDLSEPSQPMKLITVEDKKLIMVMQADIPEEMIANVMKGLAVRWALKSTASDPEKILDNTKKKLAFCFLKEYAQTVRDVGGNEMLEDEWAIKEMEKLGFFTE